MNSNLKDKITNYLAIVLVIVGAVNTFLQSQTGSINWPQLIMFVVGAVIAYFTGKNPNGTTKTPQQVAGLNLGKAMIILFILFLGTTLKSEAQTSPWKGFLKPVNERLSINVKSLKVGETPVTVNKFLFSPDIQLTAVAFQIEGGTPVNQSLSSAGLGISYGNYTTTNGTAYCNWAINAGFLTKVVLSGETSTKFGGYATVGLFNKLVNAGVGYLDNHFQVLTGVSISF